MEVGILASWFWLVTVYLVLDLGTAGPSVHPHCQKHEYDTQMKQGERGHLNWSLSYFFWWDRYARLPSLVVSGDKPAISCLMVPLNQSGLAF